MARTLHLASPLMHGADVSDMNRLLSGHNVFKTNYHPGPNDRQYGPQHASATHRAKWDLGYPKKEVNSAAGDTLRAYLTGKAKLPPTYLVRRRMRHQKPLGAKALDRMMSRHNLAESPQGSNHNWLVDWYYNRKGSSAAWCCIDVTEAYVHAGSKAFARGSRYAFVPYLEQAAQRGTDGLVRIHPADLKPGDIVTFGWPATGVGHGEHVGLYRRHIDHETIETEEGNTDAAGGAEGGQQLTKRRSLSEVNVCIRVTR